MVIVKWEGSVDRCMAHHCYKKPNTFSDGATIVRTTYSNGEGRRMHPICFTDELHHAWHRTIDDLMIDGEEEDALKWLARSDKEAGLRYINSVKPIPSTTEPQVVEEWRKIVDRAMTLSELAIETVSKSATEDMPPESSAVFTELAQFSVDPTLLPRLHVKGLDDFLTAVETYAMKVGQTGSTPRWDPWSLIVTAHRGVREETPATTDEQVVTALQGARKGTWLPKESQESAQSASTSGGED